jgi:hypothetical protein
VIQYSYFTIRIQNAALVAGERALAGLIEHLGSGEKREFGSSRELIELVTAWSRDSQKMNPDPGRAQ